MHGLKALVKRVEVDRDEPTAVADDFLTAHRLT
jgi:hypothetical protein